MYSVQRWLSAGASAASISSALSRIVPIFVSSSISRRSTPLPADHRNKGIPLRGRPDAPLDLCRPRGLNPRMGTTIEELDRRRAAARLGGGEKRIEAQHAKGRLTA